MSILFVNSIPATIEDSNNGFILAGIFSGATITVSGSVLNNGTYTTQTVTPGTITLVLTNSLTNETAGPLVAIQANKILKPENKEDLKIELGEATNFLTRTKENSSSTYRDLLDTNINFYWEIIGRESGQFLLDSLRNTNNAYLDKSDPKYLFQNFGYLMHPNKREILRRTSNPYRTFLLLLKEVFYPDFGRGESSSNPKDLEKIAEELTRLNITILEGFRDSDDITDQHTYRVLVEIPENEYIKTDIQGAIQDIRLITEIVKPAHVFAIISPLFIDSFTFDADADTLYFFTGGSVNYLDSYSSRQQLSILKFPGALSPVFNIQREEDVSIQVTGINTSFQMGFIPTYENQTTLTLASTISSASATVNGVPVTVSSVNGVSGTVTLSSPPPLNSIVKITYYYNNTNVVNTENITNQADGTNLTFFVSRFPIVDSVSSIIPTTFPADVSIEINGISASAWAPPFVYTVDGEHGYITFTSVPFTPDRAAGDTVSISYKYNSTYDYTGHPDLTPQVRENLLTQSVLVTEDFTITAAEVISQTLTLSNIPTDVDGNPDNNITVLVNVPDDATLEEIIEDDDTEPGYLLEPTSTPPGYVILGTVVNSFIPALVLNDVVQITYRKASPLPNTIITVGPPTTYTFNIDNKPIVKGFNSDEALVVLLADIDYVDKIEEAKKYIYFTANGFRKEFIEFNGLAGTINFYNTVEDIFTYTATGGETFILNGIPFLNDVATSALAADVDVFYTPFLGTTSILTPGVDYSIIAISGTVNFLAPPALAAGDKVVVRFKRRLRPDDSLYLVYYYNKTTNFLDIENINDQDGNNIVKTNARFPRDSITSTVIEPFIPREGHSFILDESYISGDVSVGHDQMGIGAESLNQYVVTYSIPGGAYTIDEDMTSLPSVSGWAWNGTVAEATGFDIVSSPGFGLQPGTYLNTGFYERPISNADNHVFVWSTAITGPTNNAASEMGVEILYGSGGSKNRLVFHMGYDSLKVNDSTGTMVSSVPLTSTGLTDYPIEGGCQNEFLVSINGLNVDFFINGIKMLAPEPQSTGLTTFVRFGKLSALSVPVDSSWDYFRFLDGTSSVINYTELLGDY